MANNFVFRFGLNTSFTNSADSNTMSKDYLCILEQLTKMKQVAINRECCKRAISGEDASLQ
jgi:hypothetical protein